MVDILFISANSQKGRGMLSRHSDIWSIFSSPTRSFAFKFETIASPKHEDWWILWCVHLAAPFPCILVLISALHCENTGGISKLYCIVSQQVLQNIAMGNYTNASSQRILRNVTARSRTWSVFAWCSTLNTVLHNLCRNDEKLPDSIDTRKCFFFNQSLMIYW